MFAAAAAAPRASMELAVAAEVNDGIGAAGRDGVRARGGAGGAAASVADSSSAPSVPPAATSARRRPRRVRKRREVYEPVSVSELQNVAAALRKSVVQQAVKSVSVPDAPEFHPTEAEWANPSAYIQSITDRAAPFGICKIVPPKGWRPPAGLFTADGRPAGEIKVATKLQSIHRLLEGNPYDDGEDYTVSEYQAVVDEGKARGFPQFVPENVAKEEGVPHAWSPGAGGGSRTPAIQRGVGLSGDPGYVLPADAEREGSGKEEEAVRLAPVGRTTADTKNSIEYCALPSDTAARLAGRVETEYWRIVETGNPKVEVEYANDIDARKMFSGFQFPDDTRRKLPREVPARFDDPEYYRETAWNLHALPRRTLLRHIHERITGVNSPWVYMGALFTSFAWHNEDNYFPSINYSHLGAAKTWYGVNGDAATRFEEALKKQVPLRFREDPDLLYHLVTAVSPMILLAEGVPVVHAVQRPGDFMVTFPRAYHSGFSHGFNIGEAVNFALPEWIPYGRVCSEVYRSVPRVSPVSHEMMLLRIGRHSRHLNNDERLVLLQQLVAVLDEEEVNRRAVLQRGIGSVVHLGNDDEPRRDCDACSYQCYLSALICPCSPKTAVCLRHTDLLCNCPPRRQGLVYWHSMEAMILLCRQLAKTLPRDSDPVVSRMMSTSRQKYREIDRERIETSTETRSPSKRGRDGDATSEPRSPKVGKLEVAVASTALSCSGCKQGGPKPLLRCAACRRHVHEVDCALQVVTTAGLVWCCPLCASQLLGSQSRVIT